MLSRSRETDPWTDVVFLEVTVLPLGKEETWDSRGKSLCSQTDKGVATYEELDSRHSGSGYWVA